MVQDMPTPEEYAELLLELEELRQERKDRQVAEALGKFNFFLHFTAFLTGCAYLVILGLLVPKAMPYVWIPIALWTAGVVYHFYWSFHPKSAAKRALKHLDKQKREEREGDQPDSDDDDGGDAPDPTPRD
ncbi:MAG: hypothetical protein KKF41_02835 [Actinobacteria bacterium]|nr:hypothetical protein [Actinomycetota bacterium]MBU2686504.1 hypothetical protein [Actinomycetota bacterium]